MEKWYKSSTGNHQGLIIEDYTGRSVAVAYDKKDAPLLAAAPDLLEMAERFASLTPDKWDRKNIEIQLDMLKTDIEMAKQAIAKTKDIE